MTVCMSGLFRLKTILNFQSFDPVMIDSFRTGNLKIISNLLSIWQKVIWELENDEETEICFDVCPDHGKGDF